jgi:hypothetical protein
MRERIFGDAGAVGFFYCGRLRLGNGREWFFMLTGDNHAQRHHNGKQQQEMELHDVPTGRNHSAHTFPRPIIERIGIGATTAAVLWI